jgi:hypothetical protein
VISDYCRAVAVEFRALSGIVSLTRATDLGADGMGASRAPNEVRRPTFNGRRAPIAARNQEAANGFVIEMLSITNELDEFGNKTDEPHLKDRALSMSADHRIRAPL